jgi:hypothetical protein
MAEQGLGDRVLRLIADIPIVAFAGGLFILLWRTISVRMEYPYDLEWMEGGMLVHAARVADGLPLYVTPSETFIPFIYPPMYPWVVGGLSTLGLPLDYALGRGVSVAGIVVAALVLLLAIRKEGGGILLGLGSAILFLVCYPDAGAFFDLVRNDGLLMGLLAAALFSVRTGWLRVGGMLLTAAYLTKHTSAVFGVPALWWLWHHEGRQAAKRFICWSVVPALGATIALTVASGGLFLTYVLGVPSVHPFVAERFFVTAPTELLKALPWMVGVIGLAWLLFRRASSPGSRFWVVQGATALLISAVMRGHHGGFLNVLIPGLWALALWSGLAIHAIRVRWPGMFVRVATSVLIAWQVWSVRWVPEKYIPSTADKVAGDAIVEQLRAIDGEVLAPWQPWMPVQAGKSGSIALIALWDIDHEQGPLHAEAQVIAKSIRSQRWGAVLSARSKLKRGLEKHYQKSPTFRRPKGKALYPKTGWRVRPHELWLPKQE